MIYLFYGTDLEKTRAKAFEWIAKARAKEPNLVYIRLAREELSVANLENITFSGGLFVKRLLILLDDPLPSPRATNNGEEDNISDSPVKSLVEEYFDALVVSDNVIVILAPKLSVGKAKKFATKAKQVYVFDAHVLHETSRGFNINLVNALATRNRNNLWLEIVRALRQGDPPEMLHSLLHWEARSFLQKNNHIWPPKEAHTLSLSLITLLIDARRKGRDLSSELERWALYNI